jgi:hypothetical protein
MVEDDLVHREGHFFCSGRRLPAGYFGRNIGVGHQLNLSEALWALQVTDNDRFWMGASTLWELLDLGH